MNFLFGLLVVEIMKHMVFDKCEDEDESYVDFMT